MACILSSLSGMAAEQAKIASSTRGAVEKLEAVNVLGLPVRYATGKSLEEHRQRALRAAARVVKELELLHSRQSLEVKFLLAGDLRSLYDSMEDLALGLGAQAIEPERLQLQATTWMSAVSDAAGPVHEAMRVFEGEFQRDLESADDQLRRCKGDAEDHKVVTH